MMRSIMTSLPAGVLVLIVCSALNVPPVDGAPRLKPRDSFVVSRDRLAQHEPAFASFDGDIDHETRGAVVLSPLDRQNQGVLKTNVSCSG